MSPSPSCLSITQSDPADFKIGFLCFSLHVAILSLNAKKNPREVSIEQEGPQFFEWERK